MTVDIGMLLEEMNTEILGKELEKRATEIHEKQGWDEFYLVYSAKPDLFLPTVIRETWAAQEKLPNPISNTIQFYVNRS